MGNQMAIPEEVSSKFATSELKSIEERFQALAEEGSFRGKTFDKKTMVNNYFPHHPEMAAAFFSAFDVGGNGKVDLLEFASGLAICCRGTTDEKLEFVFRMFDQRRHKKISPKDLSRLLSTGFFTGPGRGDKRFFTTKKEIEDYVKGLVRGAFENHDLDRDGKLSPTEFKSWASTSFEMTLILEQFNGIDRQIEESSGISGPTDFQHTTHVATTEDGGISIDNIPPSWIALFREAGVRKKELQDTKTAMYMMETLADYLASKKKSEAQQQPPQQQEKQQPAAPKQEQEQQPQQQPQAVAPPPPPPAAPLPPAQPQLSHAKPAAGSSGLLSQIQQGASLHHVEAGSAEPKQDSSNDLLAQIRQGAKLKKVEENDDVANLSKEDRHDLTSVLSKAIMSHRAALNVDDDDEDEANDDDWDDWE